MMESLWIIRHGERKDNLLEEHKNFKHLKSAPHNTPITDLGKEQGFMIGNIIECQERRLPKYVYSSPYLRSIETALEIARGLEETYKAMKHNDKKRNKSNSKNKSLVDNKVNKDDIEPRIKIRVEYGLAEPIFESTEKKEIYYDKLLPKDEHYIMEMMETSMLFKLFPNRIDSKYKSFFKKSDIPHRETLKTYRDKILKLKKFIAKRSDKLGILVCHGGLTTDLCVNMDKNVCELVRKNPEMRKTYFSDVGSSNYGAMGHLIMCPIKKDWQLIGGVNNNYLKMRNKHKTNLEG